MYIIVGLGNPGEEYARTRHNTGRMAAEFVASKIEGIRVVMPDTFMNKSGIAVAKVIRSKKADVEKHILGRFKKSEMEILKKVFKKALGAVETIVEQGLAAAMTKFNN